MKKLYFGFIIMILLAFAVPAFAADPINKDGLPQSSECARIHDTGSPGCEGDREQVPMSVHPQTVRAPLL